ncbi:SusC/RagA family TonB-linked outer membrane protein [Sphingobacterium sp. InxBP1]|uniref:SusC/RagA family TonB-linked outer membrane protein n=1 Tax=Sphingobacterium sp. InxBP1 TaxID=2870328 RepID=UPI002244B987|nr:SusC/RagA family TonB-linked outer membrane protein [Sphingobacterium sp. InxBP1]MCW8310844.1 SusC/RagA family TonB-linked outer membrane protein [Sphingobacterium sp. InxBP1]
MKWYFILFLCLPMGLSAQNMLKGIIQDESGSAIPDATITAGKNNNLWSSDQYGQFSIPVHDLPISIAVRHQSYKILDTVIYEIDGNITFKLKNKTNVLQEVLVNTGYQWLPKERATGSIVQLDRELLTKRTSLNVMQQMEGLATGLQYDNRSGNAQLNIRGLSSFSSILSKPLIVVDNFPFEGDINNINPNDVASISILKDAAATSIYGARAGNGVIVINLKKPSMTSKLDISWDYSLTQKPNTAYQQTMNSSDFIDVEMMLFEKGFYKASLENVNNRNVVFSPVVLLLNRVSKGEISAEEAAKAIDQYKTIDYREQLQDAFYRMALNNQMNMGYSFGSNKALTRVALGYKKTLPAAKGSHTDLLTLRWSTQLKISEKLNIMPGLTYSKTIGKNRGYNPSYPINISGGKSNLYPYASLFAADGAPLPITYQYNPVFLDTVGNGNLLDWTFRPLQEAEAIQNYSDVKYMAFDMQLNYRIGNGWRLSALYNYQNETADNKTIHTEDAYYFRDLYNKFTTVDAGKLVHNLPKGQIVDFNIGQMTSHKARMQLDYSKKWGLHDLVFLMGGELSDRLVHTKGSRVYGFDPNTQSSRPINYANPMQTYRNYFGLQNIPYLDQFSKRNNRFVSLYFNGAYTFMDRYIVSASARQDASNNFGKQTNNRWNPLWSVGGAWLIDKELFLEDFSFLDNMKLSFTYGFGGNVGGNTALYPLISNAKAVSYWIANQPYARVSSLANSKLKWEQVKQTNYGISFSLWKQKLSFSLEYYKKMSTDLLAADNIDPTHGFSNLDRNIGKLSSKGVDIQLGSQISNGNFKWNGQFLFSYNKNHVNVYNGGKYTSQALVANSGTASRPLEGYSLYPVFAYKFDGLDPQTGDPFGVLNGEASKDYSKLLNVPHQELIYYGSGLPLFYGSFRHALHYKEFGLSFNILYKGGHYFQKSTIMYANLFNSWTTHADYALRWQRPGDELQTTVPSLVYPANSSRDSFYANAEPNILRGDLIRLQDLQLSYDLKSKNLRYFTNMRLYLNAYNLGILWKRANTPLDPDYSFMPPSRMYSIGVHVQF